MHRMLRLGQRPEESCSGALSSCSVRRARDFDLDAGCASCSMRPARI